MPAVMPSIAFLVAPADVSSGAATNDNEVRLPRAFAAAGWVVRCLDRESLAADGGRVRAQALGGDGLDLAGFDLFFQLGFGAQATFLDRMQLLRSLDQRRFVNTTDALIYQHGKISLLLGCPDVPQPESHLANDPDKLADIVRRGGDWIAKPPASSFGRDVFRLHRGDTNTRAVLEHLTRDRRYALLQEYLPAVAHDGEKRVLIAAGTIVGAYRKRPADHRGNLDAGASAHPTTLDTTERATLRRLSARLGELGVRFAAVDVAGGKVLEINVANPGWLKTYEAVTGKDLAPMVVAALIRWAAGSEGSAVDADDRPRREAAGPAR